MSCFRLASGEAITFGAAFTLAGNSIAFPACAVLLGAAGGTGLPAGQFYTARISTATAAALPSNRSGKQFIKESVNARTIGAVSTGIIKRQIVPRRAAIKAMRVNIGTTGTAGQTDTRVLVNGTPVADTTVTILNTATDGGSRQAGPLSPFVVESGDIVEVEVTAAATGAADLTAQVILAEVVQE
jgi:hypothetical protein